MLQPQQRGQKVRENFNPSMTFNAQENETQARVEWQTQTIIMDNEALNGAFLEFMLENKLIVDPGTVTKKIVISWEGKHIYLTQVQSLPAGQEPDESPFTEDVKGRDTEVPGRTPNYQQRYNQEGPGKYSLK